jgi:hypothetical protein
MLVSFINQENRADCSIKTSQIHSRTSTATNSSIQVVKETERKNNSLGWINEPYIIYTIGDILSFFFFFFFVFVLSICIYMYLT